MPDIIASTSDGSISVSTSPYSSARNATSGTVQNTTTTTAVAGIIRFNSRGGAPPVRIRRFFLNFDTSGVSVAPSSANLKFTINNLSNTTGDSNLIAVKSDAFGGGSGLGSSEYDSIDISTPYTAEIDNESASAGDTITVALNSDALSDIAANDNFKLSLINHAHDFTNNEPSSTQNYEITLRTADYSTVASRPTISYVEGSSASGPANLTSLNGIAKASITNVNTITLANIDEINTIS